MSYDDGGPFRLVALVVGVLALVFVGFLAAVQFSSQSTAWALTTPLVLVAPVVFGAAYYYVRQQ
ncbi:hypothetical protein [Natronomonas marina]|uniref:hypothetical protein n=1 Tax=Natronomonas marina TaxID=2961939 RepID=UPI0020C9F498|nr:hypothetical protein [Natronomonas marina]